MGVTDMILACARAAHEFNRVYCLFLGDDSQVPWEEAPEWQRTSCINGVRGVLAGNTPAQSHEGWLQEKEAAGWKFGLVKDPEARTHPCFVPYDLLPEDQRRKDFGYVSVVSAMAKMVGLQPPIHFATDGAAEGRSLMRLAEAVRAVAAGGCWCPFGIGHPLLSSHSEACADLRSALEEVP